jgi:hypothetical protein
MISEGDLEKLRAAHGETSQGHWYADICGVDRAKRRIVCDAPGMSTVCGGGGTSLADDERNADFIIMAHRLTPALVAELLLLRRVVADMAEEGRAARTLRRYREALEKIKGWCGCTISGADAKVASVALIAATTLEALEDAP